MKTGKLQQQALGSKVHVYRGNGHGSTNNKIRRFTSTAVNTGSAITYADSAANGASFTIALAGVYGITYWAYNVGLARIGISVNSSELTTSIASITAEDRFGNEAIIEDNPHGCSVTLPLAVGDVVRPHTDGTLNSTTDQEAFVISLIALV